MLEGIKGLTFLVALLETNSFDFCCPPIQLGLIVDLKSLIIIYDLEGWKKVIKRKKNTITLKL